MEVLYVLEAVEVSDGEHEQEPVPLPHILLPHRAELLLTRRVQYYKQGEKVGQYNRTKKQVTITITKMISTTIKA